MAKVLRGPTGPRLRDDKGQYTAISFVTKKGNEVWISNKAVRAVCLLIVLLTALVAGSIQPSLAKAVPDTVIHWVLRGSIR